ncbi:hypothetical protein KEH51_05245 [[Brevibacterium] frigoritolerans]|uniref:Uncharacterized protein n=1 Tax=Peribacillus frigoritolerans TaxID=450367 RepID=A0A941FGC0_9BACI|nr:hypothetical protein [Peribacillus frigoritolerans]
MPKNDYLLIHTERKFVRERCKLIRKIDGKWAINETEEIIIIPTDPPPPNIDPYVFNQPWFYGYCRNANTKKIRENNQLLYFVLFPKEKWLY